CQEFVEFGRGGYRLLPESSATYDLPPAFGADAEDGACGDRDAEHLLQTDGLGTDLDFIVVPPPSPAALVLHGKRDIRPARRVGVKLDEIRDAEESEPMADQRQAPSSAEGGLLGVARDVDALMGERPGNGVGVLHPHTLDAMQIAAPRAE